MFGQSGEGGECGIQNSSWVGCDGEVESPGLAGRDETGWPDSQIP